nr:integrin alpha-E-like [Pogona vitticeps]
MFHVNSSFLPSLFSSPTDLRTEIAIVLDGSGSIEPEDFQQAKDFVYNMMKTFYEKCSECVFALVQYGLIIQTEFDLRDSRDVHSALGKVQAMRQVRNVTRTASAIQHVLDSIFSPSHGSQKNAAKIMVVLTDGEMFLDTLKLETVIHSDRMTGIERYAIGVGAAFNKTSALQELRLIASDPHERHLFRVANYSALSVLLSTLQEKIIGLEGTAGDMLEFELAQSGFSVRFLDEHHILFGAVGSFDWAGGVLLYDTASTAAVFLNETEEAASGRNGYLGYSVDAIRTRHGAWIVAGAPRHSMTGKVLVFDSEQGCLKQTLQGEQIGSYYGSEICPLDINQDGLTDHLLVGAPFFHIDGEEGKVYLYRWDQETVCFSLKRHLHGHPASVFARFGFAVAAIGDVNQDGFGDVAIGAPLEGQESNPSSCGSVYIFNGDPDGIRGPFSQRIMAAQMHPSGLVYFGRSLAGGSDFTGDGLPDVVVGSLGNVTLLRSRPVIRLESTMEFSPAKISNFQNSSIIKAKLCFHRMNPQESSQPGLHRFFIRYVVDVDIKMERKRAEFEDIIAAGGEVLYARNPCAELQLTILPCNEDCFSSILLRVSYQLRDPRADLTHPVPVLDVYQESERCFQLPYADDCENKTVCVPRLKLTVQTEKELVVGVTKELSMRIHLENTGDNSHRTTLLLEFPANLHFNTVQESLQVSSPRVECSDSQRVPLVSSSLTCKIGHPVFKTSAANFSVIWQLDGKKFPNNLANITLTITAANRNSPVLKEERILRVKYTLSYTLSSALPVIYVSARDGLSQDTHLTFHINGKNRFGAQLQLQIWVPVFLDGYQLAGIKTVMGTQVPLFQLPFCNEFKRKKNPKQLQTQT